MTSVLYVSTRFLNRLTQFLRDWYVGSFLVLVHRALSILESLDQTFALKVTLRHIFEPLYQDRSFMGHILGFVFRTIRVVIASVTYAVIVLIFAAIYVIWAVYPLYLIYCIFTNYGTAKYLL